MYPIYAASAGMAVPPSFPPMYPPPPGAFASVEGSACDVPMRRRRRHHGNNMGNAQMGAALLPMQLSAGVRIGGLALPILGALVGGVLLGLPGAVLGGIGGYLLARA